MDDPNQLVIPPSFMALYSKNGRPNERRDVIEARYDLCEDLAIQTSDACRALQWKEDVAKTDVLRRCRAGLVASDAVTGPEAQWVVTRVAELLYWRLPDAYDGNDGEDGSTRS